MPAQLVKVPPFRVSKGFAMAAPVGAHRWHAPQPGCLFIAQGHYRIDLSRPPRGEPACAKRHPQQQHRA